MIIIQITEQNSTTVSTKRPANYKVINRWACNLTNHRKQQRDLKSHGENTDTLNGQWTSQCKHLKGSGELKACQGKNKYHSVTITHMFRGLLYVDTMRLYGEQKELLLTYGADTYVVQMMLTYFYVFKRRCVYRSPFTWQTFKFRCCEVNFLYYLRELFLREEIRIISTNSKLELIFPLERTEFWHTSERLNEGLQILTFINYWIKLNDQKFET